MIPIDIPRAAYIIDYQGTMSFDRAVHGDWKPSASFAYPGTASPLHPQAMWVRFTSLGTPDTFLVAAPGVGDAQLFDEKGVLIGNFGMRVPFQKRDVARVPPTTHLPAIRAGENVYIRAWLDDESPVTPILRLESANAVQLEDTELELMSAYALLFIGVFLSLAAANVFVYFFVREMPYVIYSFMMVTNALFAATYVHGSAWRWLWPFASVPHSVAQGGVVIIEATALLAFARAFLGTRQVMPRFDRIGTWTCYALLILGICTSMIWPSAQIGPFPARTLFLFAVIVFSAIIFAMGIVALRAGSVTARFFVASNGAVTVAVALLAIAALSHYDVSTAANFVMLMNGQAIEGWLLFGALAYRLQQVTIRHVEEHRLATTDALTGISNRRTFDEAIAREWDRCARSRSHLGLLIIDVDHFKKFNDRYGHVEGDACLRRVAQAIRSSAQRPGDVCARYGGEEFAVVLPETDGRGALACGEEIAAAVRSLAIVHEASASGTVTVSIGGAAIVPYQSESPQPLIKQADGALYQAKESGRNRVFVL